MGKSVGARSRRLSLAVREPVRMDLTYHGTRFIVVEFAIATALMVGVAFWFGSAPVATHLLWAGAALLLAANSLTFLLLAWEITRRNGIPARTAYSGGGLFVYTIEAVVLLLLPGVFPLLALVQWRRT
ncbi:MAG: hypothetical protein H0X24_05670 [Ktedonobacterales bacterium]|nr:hypothetical protein [Ktedonobacterales bacterium]